MQRMRVLMLALGVSLPLAGCYYDPDYGYVRNGSGGDAYYGTETTTVVEPGYVDPGFGYYGGYGYGPGCCYSTFGVGRVWYRDRYYRRDHDWHGRPPPGGWHGGDHDHRPPPGGWHGHDGDHRPPSGGWSHGGGDHRPPPGGWNHGGGDHRPPSGGWHGGGSRPSPSRPSGGWHGGGSHGGSGGHGNH